MPTCLCRLLHQDPTALLYVRKQFFYQIYSWFGNIFSIVERTLFSASGWFSRQKSMNMLKKLCASHWKMLSPRYPASSPSNALLICPCISEQKEQSHEGFGSTSRANSITGKPILMKWQYVCSTTLPGIWHYLIPCFRKKISNWDMSLIFFPFSLLNTTPICFSVKLIHATFTG